MYYRNGREAKNGDMIVQLCNGRIENIGVLHDAIGGNEHCNGAIAPVSTFRVAACLCDCLRVDDIAEILTEKGLNVRPKGL